MDDSLTTRKSIFDRTFADDAPAAMINIKTLTQLGYSVTIKAEKRSENRVYYNITLVHPGGKIRKKFGSGFLEDALTIAFEYARDFDRTMRGDM